jgi:hypothetical protein
MRIKGAALVAGLLVVGSPLLTEHAKAENGQIAVGVAGGLLGGMLLGGALAARPAPPPPVYYVPTPERVYVEEPTCRTVRERYWDGYSWVYRRVDVCN